MAEAAVVKLDRESLRELRKTQELLEGILETVEILSDRELMRSLRESRKQVRQGKTRPLKEFLRELDLD